MVLNINEIKDQKRLKSNFKAQTQFNYTVTRNDSPKLKRFRIFYVS